MATIRTIADDVAVSLGFTHDDPRLSLPALAWYVKLAADKVVSKTLAKDMAKGDPRNMTTFLEVFTVDVTVNDANTTVPWNCLYFVLPRDIYNLPFDGGIAWVRYHRPSLPLNCPPAVSGASFTHTTIGALSRIYEAAYERPCPERPYVATDKDRVYLFGVNPLVKKLLVGLYCALPDLMDMDPDAEIPLTPDLIADVRRLVVDCARTGMMLPERLKNDGRDLDAPAPVDKQVSINDPVNIIATP